MADELREAIDKNLDIGSRITTYTTIGFEKETFNAIELRSDTYVSIAFKLDFLKVIYKKLLRLTGLDKINLSGKRPVEELEEFVLHIYQLLNKIEEVKEVKKNEQL